jgi:hypothetical protein
LPPGASGRHRLVGGAVEEDRKTLGLSDVRPSDAISGLDEVAKRAAKHEALDRIKERSGQIIMNEAVHVDARGRRWQRRIWGGLIACVLLVVGTVGGLYYAAAHHKFNPRQAAGDTRGMLSRYQNAGQQIAPFAPGVTVTAEEFKSRLEAFLKQQLAQEEGAAERQRKQRGRTDPATLQNIHRLERLITFEDGFGKPFILELKGADVVVIRSVGLPPTGDAEGCAEIHIRRGTAGPEAPPVVPQPPPTVPQAPPPAPEASPPAVPEAPPAAQTP